MTSAEIKKLSEKDLDKKFKDVKEELFNLRFQHAINQIENPMRLNLLRKDIARIKTEMRQREIAATR